MKLIIDIPKEIYELIRTTDESELIELAKAVKNGTPIPDNATNGDVLKIMFPNGITIDRSTAHAKQVTEDWLNAPYQKDGKE